MSGPAERTAAIRRATIRLCLHLDWAPLHEVTLANGRRADILALRPDGSFACIEIKSSERDFLTDGKWHEYRAFCDALFFAVDANFPLTLLPDDTGLIITWDGGAELIRTAPTHALSAPRRRVLLQRFAALGALRLAALEDPEGAANVRLGLRAE